MSNYCSRMRDYFAEMFPIPSRLTMSALVYLSIAAFGKRVLPDLSTIWSWHTAIGVWSVFALFLILRLMDELKDRDLDQILFPDRPICSGRVLESDIKRSLAIVIITYLVANLFAGPAIWSALAVLGFEFLMFRHFFARDTLRASLPLTLVTHQPVIPLLLLHCLIIVTDAQQRPLTDWNWSLVVPYFLLLWAPFLGWEISRKIRAPDEETEYVTYSRLFGPRRATCAAMTIESIPVGMGFYLWAMGYAPSLYLLLMLLNCGAYLAVGLRFLIHLNASNSQLKRMSQLYLVITLMIQVLGFGIL